MSRRLLALAAALAVLVTVVLVPVGGARPAAADGTRPAAADGTVPSVGVSATTQITDGQAVTITVRTSGSVPVYRAEAALCRSGVTYQGSTGTSRPNNDFVSDGPNCPGSSHPISSSADAYVVDSNTSTNAPSADGETFLFRLGSGVAQWTDGQGNPQTLTCDQTSGCTLVVELLYRTSTDTSQPAQWRPFTFPIAYGNNDPIAACGGANPAALDTGGSDRMADAWIQWTLGSCALPGSHGAPSRASFVGEGEAVKTFNLGSLDLAYTGGGFDSDIGLLRDGKGAPPEGDLRPTVAIPIALNAAVIGVGGGVIADPSHKVPYKDLKLSAGEAAALISGGRQGVENQQGPDSTADQPRTYRDDIAARNPEIQQTGMFDSSSGTAFPVGAFSDSEVFSWYATRYFKTLAPDVWKVPNLPSFVEDAGKPRGIDAWLGVAQPGFERALGDGMVSGRPQLRKGLIGPTSSSQGGIWILTDLETAKALNLTPVQMQDSAGNFIAPTPDSLRAAAPSMHADDHGVLVSDPVNATASGGVKPYPMTFVEYALAPTQPLLNDDCTRRTDSQKLLTDWLAYLTGDGQAKLPNGLVPLPDDLKRQATDALAKVGTAAVTGPCASVASAGGDALAAAGAGGGAAGAAANDIVGATAPVGTPAALLALPALPSIPGLPTLTPSLIAASAAAATGPGAPVAVLAEIPAFAGRHVVGWLALVLALIGVVALSSVALFATARAR